MNITQCRGRWSWHKIVDNLKRFLIHHNDAAGLPFIEVHVNTPIETCEQRDPKGLYKKARAGQLKNFTGIDDPYEAPLQPELTLDATSTSPQDAAALLLQYLEKRGIVRT